MTQQELPYGTKFVYIYIDNSNLWIQGKKTHAQRGLDPSIMTDSSWRFDVGKLREVIIRNSGLHPSWQIFRHKTTLYGSIPPPNDSVWNAIRAHDVEVKIFPRSQHNNREKQVDGQLITDAVKKAGISSYIGQECEFIIVSGDLDFKPAILEIANCGFRVHVWSWKCGMASEYAQLLHTGTNMGPVHAHCLDGFLDDITLGKPKNIVPPQDFIDTHGFVILNPAPMVNPVTRYLSALESRLTFKRYWSLLHWQPQHNFDIVIVPENITDPGWWDSLFREIQQALEDLGVMAIDLSRYPEHQVVASGECPTRQPSANPPLVSNVYNSPTGSHHTGMALAATPSAIANPHYTGLAPAHTPNANINYAVHRPAFQTHAGWFDANSRHRTNGIPREPRGNTARHSRTGLRGNWRRPAHNHTTGKAMDGGSPTNPKRKTCPLGKACMNGTKCGYTHS